MTYDELMAKAKEGDPLIDPDRPDSAKVREEGLVILGQNGDGDGTGTYASDMLIRIEPEGLRAWMRDPEGSSGEDVFHGSAWAAEFFTPDYDALVSWAYSW